MGGTKIIVLQLKEIIRTLVFALIGIILIVALIFLFLPKNKPDVSSALYLPGVYVSQIALNKEPVNVEVVVGEKEILSIGLKDMDETQEVFYPLIRPTMNQLAEEIITSQNLNIEISSENSVTGQVLLNAVRDCLAKAEIPST